MKSSRISFLLSAAAVVCLSALPSTATACSVCMGDPASKTAGAMNGAIFLMLGFIGAMLSCVAAFAFHLKRRANALPPETSIDPS